MGVVGPLPQQPRQELEAPRQRVLAEVPRPLRAGAPTQGRPRVGRRRPRAGTPRTRTPSAWPVAASATPVTFGPGQAVHPWMRRTKILIEVPVVHSGTVASPATAGPATGESPRPLRRPRLGRHGPLGKVAPTPPPVVPVATAPKPDPLVLEGPVVRQAVLLQGGAPAGDLLHIDLRFDHPVLLVRVPVSGVGCGPRASKQAVVAALGAQ